MIPVRYTLKNGGTLRAITTDRFKAGMLSVSSALPIRSETLYLFPLLLSVLRRGTEKYPTVEAINRRLDYLWGTQFSIRNGQRGGLQVVGFSADLLDSSFLPSGAEDLPEAVLDLMSQILFHPLTDEKGLLTEKYVESEKKLMCDEIRALQKNPSAYAAERLRSLVFEGHPCGNPLYGTEEEVGAVTAESLTGFWKEWVSDLHTDWFYIGPRSGREICEKIMAGDFGKRFFAKKSGLPAEADRIGGHIASNGEKAAEAGQIIVSNGEKTAEAGCLSGRTDWRNFCLIPTRTGRNLKLDESFPAVQSRLYLTFRGAPYVTDPDYFTAVILNELLGGSPISRLFVYVREKKSLCYSCVSRYRSYSGVLTVSCGLNRNNRMQAEEEILRQVRCIADGDFSEEELQAAKKSFINALRATEDDPQDLESFYYSRALPGCDLSLGECAKRCSEVTKEAVSALAAALTPDVTYFLEGTGTGEEGEDFDDCEL